MGAAADFTWVSDDLSAEFRLLFENAPFGVAQFQTQGSISAFNPALERMLGGQCAPGLSLPDLVHLRDRPELERLISELVDGQRDSFQIESETKDAGGRSLRWTAWRIPGRNGTADQVLALAEDIPAIPAGERRLQAERLETVGRLAGGVAHDFNNLLTGVLLYCDLLIATIDPDHRAHKYAEEIRKAGLQATGLVRQLLAVAKPTNREPRLLSLNEIVEGMRNLLSRLIGENIELKFQLDPNLGLIKMDPTQAQQILLNRVLNARDAMPGGGQITVETTDCRVQVLANADLAPNRRASLPCALLAIEDNGSGMDASTRAHLFEPFFSTKAGKGTGLGLATVHDIVVGNGGLIHVDSELGRGTRVSVLLPLVPEGLVDSCGYHGLHPVKNGEALSLKEEE
jgi:PAS domain S-box-containing protein